jgi:hypothetical protein
VFASKGNSSVTPGFEIQYSLNSSIFIAHKSLSPKIRMNWKMGSTISFGLKKITIKRYSILKKLKTSLKILCPKYNKEFSAIPLTVII